MKHYRLYISPGVRDCFFALGTDGRTYACVIGGNAWQHRVAIDPDRSLTYKRLPVMTAFLAHGMLTFYADGKPEVDIAAEEVEYEPGPQSRGLPPSWSNAPERINAMADIDRNA